MPDLIRHPELIGKTCLRASHRQAGFRLKFIPHLMRGRNDKKIHFLTFYETINFDEFVKSRIYTLTVIPAKAGIQ